MHVSLYVTDGLLILAEPMPKKGIVHAHDEGLLYILPRELRQNAEGLIAHYIFCMVLGEVITVQLFQGKPTVCHNVFKNNNTIPKYK